MMRELEEYEIMGACEHCGDEDVVLYKDTKRCDSCDGQFTYCTICEDEQHEGDTCRHIFQTYYGNEWAGAGADSCEAPGNAREGFIALLERMHPCFAGDLLAAIQTGRFYTFACLPVIGCGGSIELHGIPDRPFPQGMGPYYKLFFWGDELIDLGQGEHAEETSDGYHWIVSLYKDRTAEANRVTIQWIEWWLAGRTERLLHL